MPFAVIPLQWVLIISLADMLAVLILLLWIARILVRIEKMIELAAYPPRSLGNIENVEPGDVHWPYLSPMRDDRTP